MAGNAVEALESREFNFSPEDTTVTTRWTITGTVDPQAASTAAGLPSYGDAFAGDASLHAQSCHIVRTGLNCVATVIYSMRGRTTRRVVGQTEDVYESIDGTRHVIHALIGAVWTACGSDGKGLYLPEGRILWRRRQWRPDSNKAVAEPLLYTVNDAIFNAEAAFTLLLTRYRCAELGAGFWEAEYEIKIDSRNLHQEKWRPRLADDTFGAELTGHVYTRADWTGLFA